MTRPETAGAGTAEEIAAQIIAQSPISQRGFSGSADKAIAYFTQAITAAITAAESRAMERCAKIAESAADGMEDMGLVIADAIRRASINPPGDT